MKYFKEEEMKKISLMECYLKIEKEYLEIEEELKKHRTGGFLEHDEYRLVIELEDKKRKLSLPYARIKHIYSSLGDIQIREDMIEILFETFSSSKCRYGTICIQSETIQFMYQLSELFPELTKDALISISREYIKDLFDKYQLIEKLSMMIRQYGKVDTTFEQFMDEVLIVADKEERVYKDVASNIRIHYGHYPYDFVKHFEKFVQEHHISWEQFYQSVPSAELIYRDQLTLRELSLRSKDCFGMCLPITYQMFEDYLDGDTELSKYEDTLEYYASASGAKILVPFTKQEFLDSIQETHKIYRKK